MPGPADADSPATASLQRFAAECLLGGEPLPALNALGTAAAPAAQALRGIALAQLREFAAARAELAAAVAAFARTGAVAAAATALAAAGEVAAAQRDFGAADRLLARAATLLARGGERRNAAWTLAVHARLRALAGDATGAGRLLARAERALPRDVDANLAAALALARADLGLGRGDAAAAALSLQRAAARLDRRIAPALAGELGAAAAALREQRFVVIAPPDQTGLAIDAVEIAAIAGGTSPRLAARLGCRRWFVVDGIARRAGFGGSAAVPLRRRPVLFLLLHCLAAAWPQAVGWRRLATAVFGLDVDDDSLRLRAKVEIERLRRLLPPRARLVAAQNAWRLALPRDTAVVVLDLRHGPHQGPLPALLQALLADGAPWSIGALARASGCSRSSVRRALRGLGAAVRAVGAARARGYVAADPHGIASQMLLVGLLDTSRR